MSRECPNSQQEWRSKGCFWSGENGHTRRDCPNLDACGGRGADFSGDGGGRPAPWLLHGPAGGPHRKDLSNKALPCMGPGGKPMEAPCVPPSLPVHEDVLFLTNFTGIHFHKHNVIPVEVGDQQFRIPFTGFEEMGLWNKLLQTLRWAKNVKPTPVQKYTPSRLIWPAGT
ncbi:hypothetical protein HPB51_014006 [Rhipicephalus microplus]|uniref:DEAD-box RNA helicase Q domain-containing protein n=1 Tax=Rhipicephalus microplus TaxID=6941 RepID=A0A9J6D9Y4_RHIMP|nr:hypothetical protein HPB51_014006 [Rhipicephalus microplus]